MAGELRETGQLRNTQRDKRERNQNTQQDETGINLLLLLLLLLLFEIRHSARRSNPARLAEITR